MKKIILLAAAIIALAPACNKPVAELPKAEFEKNLYNVNPQASVTVTVKLDKAADASLSIPLTFGGSAVKGTDYSVSAENVSIAAGEKAGSITVTDVALSADKTVTVSIVAGGGYTVGTKYLTTVSLDTRNPLLYNFKHSTLELVENIAITIEVEDPQSDSEYAVPSDITIPFTISGNNASAVTPSANYFTIPQGQNSASIVLSIANPAQSNFADDASILLQVDKSGSSYPLLSGDKNNVKVLLKNLLVPSKLLGTWVFDRVFDLEELEMWFEEYEDDPEELPTHNDGFTLTFTEANGTVTLTPGTEGDFASYFRTATVSLSAPKNILVAVDGEQVTGSYTSSWLNMFLAEDPGYENPVSWTFFKLSSVNRSFDNTAEDLGEAVVSFRIDEDGNLQMILRDYDTPPFGFMWWDEEKFDPEMFGFASLFTKATDAAE